MALLNPARTHHFEPQCAAPQASVLDQPARQTAGLLQHTLRRSSG